MNQSINFQNVLWPTFNEESAALAPTASLLFDDNQTLIQAISTTAISVAKSVIENITAIGNKTEIEMIVVESNGLELVSFKDVLYIMLLILSGAFMVIGGSIPYVFQYVEIYQRKNATGFSLLVCLALCLANVMRILFWFGKRFEVVLLAQSVLMIITMILMLEISVRMNRKLVAKGQRASIWKGDVFSSFWRWNYLGDYIVILAVFTLVASIITAILTKYQWYVESLGMVALFTEACLGLPQLFRNFSRRSTTGMSVKMVIMWLLGDMGKTAYFIARSSPSQFWICSSMQITIDILILCQVFFYGRRTSRIPTHVPPTAAKL